MRPPKNPVDERKVFAFALTRMSMQELEAEMRKTPTDAQIVQLVEEAWCDKYLERQTHPLYREPVAV